MTKVVPWANSRRGFIKHTSAAVAGIATVPDLLWSGTFKSRRTSMGVAGSSYAIRWHSGADNSKLPGFENALQMLIHCEAIGAAGIQVGSRNWTEDFSGKVRDFREQKGLYLEGSIKLPQTDDDVNRFADEAKNSMEAGATILRTACLSGRRYENFKSDQSYREFKQDAIKSVHRAIPVIEKFGLKLAIENHKDWRVPELLELLQYFDNPRVGVNLDTGNNISFLEDPIYVIESLAPYAFTTHLKDMGVMDYEDGFLLSEVPLGKGSLDLKKVVDICITHNPDIKFNLEMITRNPLKVPYLQDQYWITFEHIPAKDITSGLKWVRNNQTQMDLPSVVGLSNEEKLVYEEQNVIDSISYAIDELKLIN